MKTKILSIVLMLLTGVSIAQSDEVWNTGYHEILGGDVYGEIYMYNDATAAMFGGDVFKIETHDLTHFDFWLSSKIVGNFQCILRFKSLGFNALRQQHV